MINIMEPLVVSFLRNHSFDDLEAEHGVCARLSKCGRKVSLNYDQLLVKNGDPVAEQCRGLIVLLDEVIDPSTSWKAKSPGNVTVIAWPMNRFYNFGDHSGANVDWSDKNLRVYEKLDGTMIVLYWDPSSSRWCVATRGVPDADVPISSNDLELQTMTFSELFFRALRETREAEQDRPLGWEPDGFDEIVHLNKDLTYVFELTSQYNKVVVHYEAPRVTLLAARHTTSGHEISIEELRIQHVQRPVSWQLNEPSAIFAFVDSADPSKLEGCVVIDSKFNRLKIKNKAWVLASRTKDRIMCSRRAIIESIIAGTIDDVIPLLSDEIASKVCDLRGKVASLFRIVDSTFHEFHAHAGNDRKAFAQLVKCSDLRWKQPFFQLYDGRADSTSEWAEKAVKGGTMTSSTLENILRAVDN
jgi:hypothetical protein